jgi:hypothetical protein
MSRNNWYNFSGSLILKTDNIMKVIFFNGAHVHHNICRNIVLCYDAGSGLPITWKIVKRRKRLSKRNSITFRELPADLRMEVLEKLGIL